MEGSIKKYTPHIINILFLLNLVIIFLLRGSAFVLMFGLLQMVLVAAYIGEILYYATRAKNEVQMDKPILTYVLMALFGIYYIPCFTMKELEQEDDYKKKNIIYLIISVVLTLVVILMMVFSSEAFKGVNTKYTSLNGKISFKTPDSYKAVDSDFYDFSFKSEKSLTNILFLYNGVDPKDYLENIKADIDDQNINVNIASKTTNTYKDKTINQYILTGNDNGVDYYYTLTTITTDKSKKLVVYVYQKSLKDDWNVNKRQFKKVIDSFEFQ